MVKNIIFGVATLLFVNWLLNINKVNKLHQRIAEEKQITLNLVKTLEKQDRAIDSLEIVLIRLENTN
tara:strand:- start:329 stop:529 length:201 start_codon:yes stop_codon:yes gene_type:complete